MKRSRNQKIDHLRALAILCIILAHTGLQGILFNLRCFDVPLMAFCLAISYYYSSKNLSYISYVKKKIHSFNSSNLYISGVIIYITFFHCSDYRYSLSI